MLWDHYENSSCIEDVESRQVRGTSLEGVIPEGSQVELLKGYYRCNKIRREDLVVYPSEDGRSPLIKIAKGIPGDRFSLEKVNESWKIRINDKILRTAQGAPYQLSHSKAEVLQKEQERTGGKIPPGFSLIFGNIAHGSIDSTHFGLVPLDQLLGKATCPDCFNTI